MPQYKLTYFTLRGKAEAIRMVFSVAGVEFEDVRFSLDEWFTKYKHCEYQISELESGGYSLQWTIWGGSVQKGYLFRAGGI